MNVYAYKEALYCEECGKKLIEKIGSDFDPVEPDDFPVGPYLYDAIAEADSPLYCDDCGIPFVNSLINDEYDDDWGDDWDDDEYDDWDDDGIYEEDVRSDDHDGPISDLMPEDFPRS